MEQGRCQPCCWPKCLPTAPSTTWTWLTAWTQPGGGPPPSCPAGGIGARCDAVGMQPCTAVPVLTSCIGQMLLLDSDWVLPASLRAGAGAPSWTKPWGLLRVPEPRFVPFLVTHSLPCSPA